jgi:SNF2 family DNA or RNA helicase
MSLPMGSGKTVISLELLASNTNSINLIVASKTLVNTWKNEMKKFYNKDITFLHLKEPVKITESLYITTPSTLLKYYKLHNIEGRYVIHHYTINTVEYSLPKRPFMKSGFFYGTVFDNIIVDEAHVYSNCETSTNRAISSVYAKNRILLTGTIVPEPKPSNILGIYTMLGNETFSTLPEVALNVFNSRRRNNKFNGISELTVHRDINESFTVPEPKKMLIKYNMNDFESRVFGSFKTILNEVSREISTRRLAEDHEAVRVLNAQFMSLILNLRISLVSPVLSLSRLFISCIKSSQHTMITSIIKRAINDLEPDLNNKNNLISSRMSKILDIVNTNNDKKIVIFSSFRMVIDYLMLNLNGKHVFTLESTFNLQKRDQVIKDFEKSNNGILLLTYTLGGEGLNLQFADTVILTDMWWNDAKMNQAIARLVRYGQEKHVSIYTFLSNTYLERVILAKHSDKNSIGADIMNSSTSKKVSLIKRDEILKIINH